MKSKIAIRKRKTNEQAKNGRQDRNAEGNKHNIPMVLIQQYLQVIRKSEIAVAISKACDHHHRERREEKRREKRQWRAKKRRNRGFEVRFHAAPGIK